MISFRSMFIVADLGEETDTDAGNEKVGGPVGAARVRAVPCAGQRHWHRHRHRTGSRAGALVDLVVQVVGEGRGEGAGCRQAAGEAGYGCCSEGFRAVSGMSRCVRCAVRLAKESAGAAHGGRTHGSARGPVGDMLASRGLSTAATRL